MKTNRFVQDLLRNLDDSEAGEHVASRLREAADGERDQLMGRSRRSRYALEFLERKLNLSTTATGIVAAEVSTTPAPDAAPTVAPVAPAPGDSSATVQSMQNSPGVASTSSDDVAHKPAENLLSAPASGSQVPAMDDPSPSDDPPPPPPDPPAPSGQSGSGSGAASGSSSGAARLLGPALVRAPLVAAAAAAEVAARVARGRATTPWCMAAVAPCKAAASMSRAALVIPASS